MKFRGIFTLFLTVSSIQMLKMKSVHAAQIDQSLEASALKTGYAIRLLKPLPRRNSGCETIFRGGEVLESCDANYGVDPAIDGVIRNYCEWNLHTHFQKNNSAKWLESYHNPNLIMITNAKVGFTHDDEYRTIYARMRKVERIIYRWIELEFKDQITGTKLGSLKCYPSKTNEYIPAKEKLYGSYQYHYDQTLEANSKKIKSGLSIGNILDQLSEYVEIIKIN